MIKSSKVSNALSLTLSDCDLQSVCVEWADVLSDTLFEEGLVKDIPIIGTIYGLGKFGVSVRDRLFLKKLHCLLREVADIPPKQRAEIISKIDRSGKYRVKVGDKLLYLFDKSEDHEIAQVVAFFVRAVLSGDLSYDDFLRASRAIQSIMVADLWRFVDDEKEGWDASAVADLLNSGLVALDELDIRVEDHHQNSWKDREKYDVHGAEITASITKLGKKVRSILRSRKAPKEPNPT